jgi:hypothetical protein
LAKNFFVQNWAGEIDNILEREFALLYISHGNITLEDIEKMTVYERDFIYRRYLEIRAEEKRIAEEQQKEQQNQIAYYRRRR